MADYNKALNEAALETERERQRMAELRAEKKE